MAKSYFTLTVDLAEQDAEPLEDLLHEAGAGGLELRDREAAPMPGVRQPSPGEVIVVAYFGEHTEAEEARRQVADAFPAARATLEEQPDQDWSNAWKSQIRSVQVGRLWVGPPWLRAEAPKDLLQIEIEPKMAFGTGDHPTTSLCLALADRYLPTRPGASVLDVGTGTGVLAIAAKKLGAGRAVGVDNDPVSVELAQENAALNHTPELELSTRTLDQIDGTFDLVFANILANTLVALSPLIAPKVKDRLALAGVLAPQAEEVTRAFVDQGLTFEGQEQVGEWVRLDLVRR
jgi:ribosomal protein L11 methyltransferase